MIFQYAPGPPQPFALAAPRAYHRAEFGVFLFSTLVCDFRVRIYTHGTNPRTRACHSEIFFDYVAVFGEALEKNFRTQRER